MKQPHFQISDLLIRTTAWSNVSNAGIASWQIDLLVTDGLPSEICTYCMENWYMQISMLNFTFLIRVIDKICAIV